MLRSSRSLKLIRLSELFRGDLEDNQIVIHRMIV